MLLETLIDHIFSAQTQITFNSIWTAMQLCTLLVVLSCITFTFTCWAAKTIVTNISRGLRWMFKERNDYNYTSLESDKLK